MARDSPGFIGEVADAAAQAPFMAFATMVAPLLSTTVPVAAKADGADTQSPAIAKAIPAAANLVEDDFFVRPLAISDATTQRAAVAFQTMR